MTELDSGSKGAAKNLPQGSIRNPVIKMLVMGLGWLCVVLGFAGIFLPVLPTTPFLLLAAACFVRTSPQFYQWLIRHPRMGKYLVYYLDGKGMPLRANIIPWGTSE